MDLNFIVQIPVANSLRFTLDGVPNDHRASYDKRRYYKTIHATTQQRSYPQLFESADTVRVQYYSNYLLQRVRVISCPFESPITVYQTYTPEVAIQYQNKKYRADAKFSSINDKLFIYFNEGQEYSDEDFLVPGDTVSWLGRLPNIRAVVGDILRFDIGAGFVFGDIQSIAWSPTLQAQGYLTDLDYTLLNPVDGLVEVTYDEKEANLYSQLIPLNGLLEGEYFVELGFGVSSFNKLFYTEPLDVRISHPKTLAIEYRHNGTYEDDDIWSYIYLSDWTNIIRFPTDFYKFVPAGEVDQDIGDFGLPRMLRAVPFRQVTFEALNIPSWIADKLMVIFSHDSKKINEYYWENENLGEFDMIDRADLGTYTIQLKQVNDRTNFLTEFTEDVTASWSPPTLTDIVFGGTVVSSTFVSNSVGVFSFRDALPAWITPSVSTFSNGDEVDFTIAANGTAFSRVAELIAICEELVGVEAALTFEQLYDDSVAPPEFIEVDDETVALGYAAGSNQLLSVSASSDYNIVISGSWTFTAVKENGILNVRISEPTNNHGGSNRTGNVRLELISNPAVFVDIAVTQIFRPDEILSLTPAGEEIDEFPNDVYLDVETEVATQWQASSSDAWLSFNTTIHTGSMTGFSIHATKKPVYITERNGYVTFFNIANPGDYLVFNVRQVDAV